MMGFLSSFEKKDASTTDGSATFPTTAHHDLENDYRAEQASGSNALTTPASLITPKMEKQLVRKLDRRLVPLVMGLCMTL